MTEYLNVGTPVAMARAHDVAVYLRSKGANSALRLQKLLYYAQAWSLAWDGAPLFGETIRAWDMGPVVGEVWHACREGVLVGDAARLTPVERATIDAVMAYYGTREADWLSELTHRERPWVEAYAPKRPNPIITHDAMRAFYGSLSDGQKCIPESYKRGADYMMSMSPDELAELGDTSMTELTPAHLDTLLREDGGGAWPA